MSVQVPAVAAGVEIVLKGGIEDGVERFVGLIQDASLEDHDEAIKAVAEALNKRGEFHLAARLRSRTRVAACDLCDQRVPRVCLTSARDPSAEDGSLDVCPACRDDDRHEGCDPECEVHEAFYSKGGLST